MREDYHNVWYPLEEFPSSQYEINKLGEVRNKRTGQKLKGTVSKEGYLAYLFTIGEKSYRRFAHIIVAKQFIPNPNGYPIVNHKDENKLNPCVDNLEWITYAQNSSHGTAQSRSESRRSKPINEYDLDGTFLRTWKSVKKLYLYHNLPYDRKHRPTYLIKILTKKGKQNVLLPLENSVFLLLEVPLQQALLVLASFISLASAQAPKLTHSAARPLQIKPALLGFDLGAAYLKYLSSKPFRALP